MAIAAAICALGKSPLHQDTVNLLRPRRLTIEVLQVTATYEGERKAFLFDVDDDADTVWREVSHDEWARRHQLREDLARHALIPLPLQRWVAAWWPVDRLPRLYTGDGRIPSLVQKS